MSDIIFVVDLCYLQMSASDNDCDCVTMYIDIKTSVVQFLMIINPSKQSMSHTLSLL